MRVGMQVQKLMPKRWLISALLVLLAIGLLTGWNAAPAAQAATPAQTEDAAESKGSIVIGSWEWTQPLLMTELTVQLLEDAGYEVEFVQDEFMRDAILADGIDLYWDYIASGLTLWHGIPAPGVPHDPDLVWEMINTLDQSHNNLVWLPHSQVNDPWVIMIRPELYEMGITTIEALADHINQNPTPDLTFCVEDDFYSSEIDGLQALFAHYDFSLPEEQISIVAVDSLYEDLRNGACDVAEGFATDGRIRLWELPVLEDTLDFFLPFHMAPVVRQEVLDTHPEIAAALAQLTDRINNADMAQLSGLVDVGPDAEPRSGDEQAIADVARAYLATLDAATAQLDPAASDAAESSAAAAPTVEASQTSTDTKGSLVFGSWEWTQPLLMTEIAMQLLEEAGYEVTLTLDEFMRDAILADNIDLYWDYTGSGLTLWHGLPARSVPDDPDLVWEMINRLDQLHHNLTWLRYSLVDEPWVIMASASVLDLGLSTIDDLAAYVNANPDNDLIMCVEDDFYSSETDGLYALFNHYGFSLPEENINIVAIEQLYEGIRNGECDVAEGFATDGRIPMWELPILEDNRDFFVPFHLALVVRNDTLAAHPELTDLLERISPRIDTSRMAELSGRVEVGRDGMPASGDEEDLAAVARDFLQQARLLPKAQVRVGSAATTEQMLLGQLIAQLLSDAGYQVVDQTGLGEMATVRAARENGEIDIYPAYLDALLATQYNLPPVALPSQPERLYLLAQSLEANNGWQLLERIHFNGARTLVVSSALAEQGVATLDDLAAHMADSDVSLTLCTDAAFAEQEQNGLAGLAAHYGLAFVPENVLLMPQNETYAALRAGECDVAVGANTDGRIRAWGLMPLEDTQAFFPLSAAAPVARQSLVDNDAELTDLLNRLGAQLDAPTMRALHAAVELGPDGEPTTGDEQTAADAARALLDEIDLLDMTADETNVDEPDADGAAATQAVTE